MAIIDIVIITVLVIFGIIGMAKGFLNTIISLFGNLASLAIAFFTAKPVSSFLDKTFGIVSKLASKIAPSFSAIAPLPEGSDLAEATLTGADLKTYLSTDGLTFQERLISMFINDETVFTSNAEIVEYISGTIAGIAAMVISAVVMFILIRIAILLLAKLFDALTKNKAIGGLDRVVGLLFGLLKGALLVFVVLSVFYLIANTTVDGWIQNSVVTKWLYQYVCQIVDSIVSKFNLPDIIKSIFPSLQG